VTGEPREQGLREALDLLSDDEGCLFDALHILFVTAKRRPMSPPATTALEGLAQAWWAARRLRAAVEVKLTDVEEEPALT